MGSPSDRLDAPGVTRRRFLRGAGLGGVGGAVAALLPGTQARADTTFKHVYRLSFEGEQACHACRHHARHRYYRLPRYARANRAHLGCNCDVIGQLLPQHKWRTFFLRHNGTLRRVWDVRWTR